MSMKFSIAVCFIVLLEIDANAQDWHNLRHYEKEDERFDNCPVLPWKYHYITKANPLKN